MPVPFIAPTPAPLADLIPDIHLARLTGLKAPRIVMVGDSISTRKTSISHDMIDTFWGHFTRAFLLSNPGLKPDFRNRAIGRTRYDHFAEAKLGETLAVQRGYEWVDDPEAAWFSQIEALEPDLLIQSFGMNDAERFKTGGFQALQARIDGWKKQPDRVYITSMLPSRKSDHDGLSGEQGQQGRMFNAHYIRSWALYHGYGLIDLNRAQSQIVQGFDPRVSDLVRADSTGETVPSTAPHPCQDFGLSVSGESLRADLAAGLVIQIGAEMPRNPDKSVLRLKLDRQGHLVIEFSDLKTRRLIKRQAPYLVHRSAEPVGDAPEHLAVFAKDVFVHVELDGVTVFYDRVRRHGGVFLANVARKDGRRSTSAVQHFTGQFRKHKKYLSDVEGYGAKPPGNWITGGNFKNHPSSLMAAYVFAPLLESTRLTIPRHAPQPHPPSGPRA